MEALKVRVDKDGNPVLDKNGDYIILGKRVLADWFPNKILDNGRNRMGTNSDWLNACQVGTDSTLPLSTDTGLLGYLAGTSSIITNTVGAEASAPYYAWRRKKYRFSVGAAAGNISEVGVGWSTSAGAFLITRALIVDANGDPTTPTVQSDELLDVTYEMRYYPPLTDVTGQVTLNSVVYDYTIRAAKVNSSSDWANGIGSVVQANTTYLGWLVYSGNLGTIVQDPNGTTDDSDNDGASQAYSNNSFQRKVYNSCGINGWNLVGGIRSFIVPTTAGRYQMEVSSNPGGTTIPKDNTFQLFMQWVISWAAANVAGQWTMIAASDSTTPASGEWNTNLAGTTLRVAWVDNLTNNAKQGLRVESGTVFRITDSTDSTKWVEYTVSGAYTEFASWTEYTVSQTGINNSGPTVTNSCDLKNLKS